MKLRTVSLFAAASFFASSAFAQLPQTGNDVLIGGFIVQGTGPKSVIVRAIGPELTPFGIPNALADPTLELHNGTGALIASNDNWQTTVFGGIITSNQVSAIQNSGHAPTQPSESAIIATLPAGKLHRDRAWQEQHHWGCSRGSVRSQPQYYFSSRQHQYASLCSDGQRRDDWWIHCSRRRTKDG